MDKISLILLFRILAAHFVADFVFIGESWKREIFQKKWRSYKIYIHAGCSALLIFLSSTLFGVIWFPLVVFVSRLLSDGLSFSEENQGEKILLEQSVKIAVLLVCFIFFEVFGLSRNIILFMSPEFSFKFWLIACSYIIIFWPVGLLIGQMTEQWRGQIKKESLEGLGKAGLWIGRLERLLILTFVLINRFEAIGFLIAAKSIFRIGEITNSKNRKVAEYILIGTLLSVVSAIFLGIITKWLLSQPLSPIQRF